MMITIRKILQLLVDYYMENILRLMTDKTPHLRLGYQISVCLVTHIMEPTKAAKRSTSNFFNDVNLLKLLACK